MRVSARAMLALLAVVIVGCNDNLTPPSDLKAPVPPPLKDIGGSIGSPNVVISQVYPGGGNSGATYKVKYVELLNRGATTVSLNGWSLQYASATSTGAFGGNGVATLSGDINPGQYILVQVNSGTNGADLPVSVDIVTSTKLSPSASAGKLALVSSTTGLTCNGGSKPCTQADSAAIVDLIGYGTGSSGANFFEGTGPAPTLTAAKADFRAGAGCTDTNDNAADFSSNAPAPRNHSSAPASCPGIKQAGPLDHVDVAAPTTSVSTGSTLQVTATAKDAAGTTITDATIAWSSSDNSVATVDANGKVLGVTVSSVPVTITATATSADGTLTKSGSIAITVTYPKINWVDLSFTLGSVPPGFQSQMFMTARTGQGGTVIPSTFTVEALDADIATVVVPPGTSRHYATALSYDAANTRPGFKITATPIAGGDSYVFTTHGLLVEAPVSLSPDQYGHNDEFGRPTATSSTNYDNFLIERPQYTLSFNASRGTPNWVSFEMDHRQYGAENRCNCFSIDPLLPADKQIWDSDYTNGGYDRGHMTRSADRTFGNVDNAMTYYMTNIVPQLADLNQGVWASFENALGDSAKTSNRAVYVITGPLYNTPLHYLKDEGRVAIPDATWKVAIIGPDDSDHPFEVSDADTWRELDKITVLAVLMPNVSGIRNDPWSKYQTTVDAIEAATGFDFLSALPPVIQRVLEGNEAEPKANAGVSYSSAEGSALTLTGGASTYPAGDDVTFTWNFGDGTAGSGVSPTHTYSQDGTYTATLTITDPYGANTTASATVTVSNVAPVINALPSVTILRGETYTANGGFTDPGSDTWSATVNYGDNSGAQSLSLNDHAFTLSHTYSSAGNFTVAVTVNDGSVTVNANAVVTVLSAVQGVTVLENMVQAVNGLEPGVVNSLRAKLNAATAQLRQKGPESSNILRAFENEVNGLSNGGQIDAATASAIVAYAERVIASI